MRLKIVCLAVLLFLAGCGYLQRQAIIREKFPHYPESIKRAIEEKRIVERMSQEQVFLALGVTLCRTNGYYNDRAVEIWAYEPDFASGQPVAGTFRCSKATQRVYFENGLVVGWENL